MWCGVVVVFCFGVWDCCFVSGVGVDDDCVMSGELGVWLGYLVLEFVVYWCDGVGDGVVWCQFIGVV